MRELLDQLQTFYAGLEPQRRKVLWAALALSLLTIVGVGFWAATPTYVLFTRASSADQVTEVTQALASAGVPYKIDADGVSLRVPLDRELEARRVAASGDGIVGLEGLLQIDPWTTPFQESLHRQRMLQGELTRMINGINGVAASVVQLNVPQTSAFLRNMDRPSAAVTLRPEASVRLDGTLARGVAVLTSHAVAGMKPEDVTVLDASTGRLLWDENGGELAGVVALEAAARARETQLSASVRQALTQILGRADAATVNVTVETDSSQTEQKSTIYDPSSVITTKESIISEKGTTSGATGVPGTDSNVPENGATTGGAQAGRTKESQDSSYEASSTSTTIITPAGAVKRISAAVMVDSAAVASLVGAGDPLPVQAAIEKAVSAALGADTVRGDIVVVTFLPFAPVAEIPEVTASPVPVELVVQGGVAMAVVVAAFVFLVRPLLQAVRPAQAAAPAAARVAAAAAASAAAAAAAVAEPEPELAPPLDFTARLRAQLNRVQPHDPHDLSELVRHEPALAAEVVRRWIQRP